MAAEKSPAYQWYVKDWRSSRKVQLMSWKVRGMYREMLDEQWDAAQGLPNNAAALAVLLGGAVSEWARHLPQLRGCFSVQADGTLLNLRLEKERAKQRKRSTEGKAGGQARVEGAGRDGSGRFSPADQPATAGDGSSGHAGESPDVLLHLHSPLRIASKEPARPPIPMNGTLDDVIADRAGRFCERYAELYPLHRRGARYFPKPALDFPKACELCAVWDNDRLEKLAIVFLKCEEPFAQSGSRTIGQFAAMASWADGRLREVETPA